MVEAVLLVRPVGSSGHGLPPFPATGGPAATRTLPADPIHDKRDSAARPWDDGAMDVEHVVFTGFEGVRLVADVRGDPDGWPVLFLHGGGQTRHAWGSTAATVAREGWRTVA